NADGLGYDETHASGVGIIVISQAVGHETLGAHPDPGAADSSEGFAAADPACCGEHTQAETSERPSRRRAARPERPARLRMRRRTPRVLARWRSRGLTGRSVS